jgi:hypothetical protein
MNARISGGEVVDDDGCVICGGAHLPEDCSLLAGPLRVVVAGHNPANVVKHTCDTREGAIAGDGTAAGACLTSGASDSISIQQK